jgi:hypothetical protein
MYALLITAVLLILFGRDTSEVKILAILGALSMYVWLAVAMTPLMFACTVTIQTAVLWIVVDAMMSRVPVTFSVQWLLGGNRLVFALLPA